MSNWLVAVFAAIVFDIIVGVVTYKALSITSISPLATNLLTLSVMSVFLIVEIIGITLLSNKSSHH